MQLISALELFGAMKNTHNFEIVDVREPYEYQVCNIGSLHIPMGEVCDRVDELPKEKNIVIMCRSGKRAEAVANILLTDYSLTNIYVLEGGILSWKEYVDNSLEIE
jgi:rhodanese-related sulfurtransferase